jgi:diaminopimelate decarboxylase
VENGFDPKSIVFSGVGKSDKEIETALKQAILCFNCESIQELEVINGLAAMNGKTADIALRINPNVHAYTHKYITTGLEENKFGINPWEFDAILDKLPLLKNIRLVGLHFHIGSQITDLSAFKNLCVRVNEINRWFADQHFYPRVINLGGGLGIDYKHPDENPVPDFSAYFHVFREFIELLPGQELHLEPGRALVAQCGSLITKVLYIKKGVNVNFAICDAGMTELIRPALYQAFHRIQNITSLSEEIVKYDVVGPICESSDCFGKSVVMPETFRGDLIALRSAGAYGETMASQYNLRDLVGAVYSDEL